jgi:hypothetical protein
MEQTITPRTQKARGVMWLQDNRYLLPGNLAGHINYHKVLDARTASPNDMVARFCRPCPMRPRHGFVDSKFINNPIEAQQMIDATLAADPDAEILTAEPIEADYSAVWTKGVIAIGKGTDGATAGTSSRTLPVTGDLLGDLDYSGIIAHSPYAELLYKHDKPYIVQLRDGEPIPDSADWVPFPVTVTRVVRAEGDLLEWESLCRTLSGEPGIVVDHSNGGSLASHYAQHCVLNNLPIITSHVPQLGETLTSNSATPHIDIKKLRSGFVAAQRMPINYTKAAHIMLAGCHHIAKWAGREDYLLGLAMGAAYRLTIVAALGEIRHLNKRKRDRNIVYRKAWDRTDTPAVRRAFTQAIAKFGDPDRWQSKNYGGHKWEEFSLYAVAMYHDLILANPKSALESFNRLVNAAHNSGWAFDKFVSQSAMSIAAASPVQMVVACAPQLYESHAYAGTTWKRRQLRIPAIRQPNENTNNGTIVAAQIFVDGNKGHVQYKYSGESKNHYNKLNVILSYGVAAHWAFDTKDRPSFAGGGKLYAPLQLVADNWYYHSQKILSGKES